MAARRGDLLMPGWRGADLLRADEQAGVSQETPKDTCRTCKQPIVYLHDCWWHGEEVFGNFDGSCDDPQPKAWQTERGLT